LDDTLIYRNKNVSNVIQDKEVFFKKCVICIFVVNGLIEMNIK